MKQEDFLNYILDLKRANPSMDIHFCMDSENAYEYGWMPHEIMEVEICPWYETPDGRLLIDETDIKLSMQVYFKRDEPGFRFDDNRGEYVSANSFC